MSRIELFSCIALGTTVGGILFHILRAGLNFSVPHPDLGFVHANLAMVAFGLGAVVIYSLLVGAGFLPVPPFAR